MLQARRAAGWEGPPHALGSVMGGGGETEAGSGAQGPSSGAGTHVHGWEGKHGVGGPTGKVTHWHAGPRTAALRRGTAVAGPGGQWGPRAGAGPGGAGALHMVWSGWGGGGGGRSRGAPRSEDTARDREHGTTYIRKKSFPSPWQCATITNTHYSKMTIHTGQPAGWACRRRSQHRGQPTHPTSGGNFGVP